MRFHMRAASATSVETPLQPGSRTILMGSVYRRSYSNLVASPGSHCKDRMTQCSTDGRESRWAALINNRDEKSLEVIEKAEGKRE